MSHLDHLIQELNEEQGYICDAGCGACDPVEYDFVYQTGTTPEGDVVETHAHKAWKSDCCGATMSIWDHVKQDNIGEAAAPLNLTGDVVDDLLDGVDPENLTQEEVDQIAAECKREWDKSVADSALFGISHDGVQVLALYEQMREHVESLGLTLPPLVEGMTVTLTSATHVTCWSCDTPMTKSEHSENDGHCIHCNVEIEL